MKPSGPIARRGDYKVEKIDHAVGADFIRAHHYARGCANTSVFAHGLFRAAALVGVALWLPPTKVAAQSVARLHEHEEWRRVLSLSRLALAPSEPRNAESLFIGRSLRLVWRDSRWVSLVTYADTRREHTGVIYRATNWEPRGLTKPEPCFLDASGRQVARKSASKSRTRAEMEALGYRFAGSFAKHKFTMRRAA